MPACQPSLEGVGIFSLLTNVNRLSSESDAFFCLLYHKGWTGVQSYCFNSFRLGQFISGSAFLEKIKKTRFPLHPVGLWPPPSWLFVSFQPNLFLSFRIASLSWREVGPHPHVGTRMCPGLYWLKLLVWWARNKSLTSWLPAVATVASGETHVPLDFCLFICL